MLVERQHPVEVLDGDAVRTNLCKGLGFTRRDRDENVMRIGFVAELLCRHGVGVVVAAVSPYADARQELRKRIGDFVEVHVDCPLSECERRDSKGMYALARAGRIERFTGVGDPYQAPQAPELRLDTQLESPEQSAARVIQLLEGLGYLAERRPSTLQHGGRRAKAC